MKTEKDKDLLIYQLQEHKKAMEEMLENQFKIIGIKDLLICRLSKRIEELEKLTQKPFYSFSNRDN